VKRKRKSSLGYLFFERKKKADDDIVWMFLFTFSAVLRQFWRKQQQKKPETVRRRRFFEYIQAVAKREVHPTKISCSSFLFGLTTEFFFSVSLATDERERVFV
jgi:hypothetical protein